MTKQYNTINDYESAARLKLSEKNPAARIGDYIQKSAGSGRTMQANRDAFDRYQIVPRVLGGITNVDTSVDVVGGKIETPFMIAPTAWHTMFCPNGEIDTANAAYEKKTRLVASFYSNKNFEQMGAQRGHLWFNLLPYKDKRLMQHSIDKAAASGCSAIVLTVDAPLGCKGSANFAYPIDQLPLLPRDNALPFTDIKDYYEKYVDSAASWKDIADIVESSSIPIILKGILHEFDADYAIKAGIKGIIISNHGGRQMDGVIGTLDALAKMPHIGRRKEMDVYLDGGIRSGEDAFKALALGAKAVLIGRPALYGLSVNGKDGLVDVLDILNDELKEIMHMSGCATLADISPERIHGKRQHSWGI